MKPHIGIFGRRNYGKSSLVNYLTGQQIAIVFVLIYSQAVRSKPYDGLIKRIETDTRFAPTE